MGTLARMIKKRIIYAFLGLGYMLALVIWGGFISGGGHFMFWAFIFIQPKFGGWVWPIWGFLSVSFDHLAYRIIFICTMILHVVGAVLYCLDPYEGKELHTLWYNMHDPTYFLVIAPSAGLYATAQVFLWRRFLRDLQRDRREGGSNGETLNESYAHTH